MRPSIMAAACSLALAAPAAARELTLSLTGLPVPQGEAELLFEFRDTEGSLREERRIPVESGPLPETVTASRLPEQPGVLRGALISGGRVVAATEPFEVTVNADSAEAPPVLAANAMGFSVPMRCGTTRIELQPGDAEIHLSVEGQSHVLPQVIAASGARHELDDNMVWQRGNRATVRLDGVELPECAPVLGPLLLPMDGAGAARDGVAGWSMTLTAEALRLQTGGAEPLELAPLPPFVDGNGAVVFDTPDVHIRLDAQRCRPGGDALQLPITVTIAGLGGDDDLALPSDSELRGCAGTPAELLAGTPWRVDSLLGLQVDADLPDMPELTLQVRQDRISGRAACNRYFGVIDWQADSMTFGDMAMTRMACPSALMALESRFLDAMERVNRFELTDGGRLVLYSGSVPLMTARR